MRFSNLASILVGAGLAVQAGALPVRIVLVEGSTTRVSVSGNGEITNVKYDHWQSPPLIKEGGRRRMGSCKNKAVVLSNKFREFFGMPLIEVESQEQTDGFAHILPFPHEMKEPVWINANEAPKPVPAEDLSKVISSHPHYNPYTMPHPPSLPSFWRRIQFSLMALGPWEGRAVAFVLGCGLGVLLRMIFVLTIVLYRTIRGGSQDPAEYDHIVFDQDAENILVAPPQYTTYTDEKTAVPVEAEQERK